MNFDLIQTAYSEGDCEGLKNALGNPSDFPNTRDTCGETCLDYALYHSPITLVRELLELGADPNYEALDGFPSLFAAISSNHNDRRERVELLLNCGADIQQRGINDYTALHFAVTQNHADVIALLLERGADITARTRIDDCGTPLEEAERFGHEVGAEALRKFGVCE